MFFDYHFLICWMKKEMSTMFSINTIKQLVFSGESSLSLTSIFVFIVCLGSLKWKKEFDQNKKSRFISNNMVLLLGSRPLESEFLNEN